MIKQTFVSSKLELKSVFIVSIEVIVRSLVSVDATRTRKGWPKRREREAEKEAERRE